MNALQKWIIGASTAALLAAGGWRVSVWDDERGQAVVNEQDTLWFTDSAELANFARFEIAKMGVSRFVPWGEDVVPLMKCRTAVPFYGDDGK